jgi:ribosomal protein S18 acetylase RimI-like enzyme
MDAVDRISPPPRPGERLVLRHRLADASATDVIGWVEEVGPGTVVLTDADGRQVTVSRASIVAVRRVPTARGGRDPLRTSPAELEQITLPGWVADQEPLGDWTLRAAGGFTGRANSCLAVGDPGVGAVEAAARIVAFSADHSIVPRAQVVAGSEQEESLRSLGWRETYVRTDVLVTRLAELLGQSIPDPRVELGPDPDPAWWSAYERSRPSTVDVAVRRRVLLGPHPRALGGVRDSDRVFSIGRGHLSQDWLGLSSLWTDPDRRRQGWAETVVRTLGHWAARQGARSVYLQVAQENEAAHRAYGRLGFVHHHEYLYLGPPGS